MRVVYIQFQIEIEVWLSSVKKSSVWLYNEKKEFL